MFQKNGIKSLLLFKQIVIIDKILWLVVHKMLGGIVTIHKILRATIREMLQKMSLKLYINKN